MYVEHLERSFGIQDVSGVQLCAMFKPQNKETGYYPIECTKYFCDKTDVANTLNNAEITDLEIDDKQTLHNTFTDVATTSDNDEIGDIQIDDNSITKDLKTFDNS